MDGAHMLAMFPVPGLIRGYTYVSMSKVTASSVDTIKAAAPLKVEICARRALLITKYQSDKWEKQHE